MTLLDPEKLVETYSSLDAFRAVIAAANDAHAIPLAMDGGCPCFHAEAEGVRFDGHCWRVCSACEYAGVHVTGNVTPEARAAAVLLKEKLNAMNWYGEWTLSWEERDS